MKRNSDFSRRRTMKGGLVALAMMLVGMCAQAQVYFTPLGGSQGASSAENYDALVDGNLATKWCVNNMINDGVTGVFIVMQATEPVVISDYWLTTGNDVNRFPSRNWKTWRIYGANFASEEEAVRSSEAWELVDEKWNVSSSMFVPTNRTTTRFTVSESNPKAYNYFKIEVMEIIDMNTGSTVMEMSEFSLEAPTQDIDIEYVVGNTNGNWGDGAPENFCDGEIGTKWGGSAPTWAIYKTPDPITPKFYTLTTGNDTKSYSDRNWREWQVWGANFESDADASRDAAGWVLIDSRSGADANRLPVENYAMAYFGLNDITTPYQYYKIEIMNDGAQQMSEFGLYDNDASFAKVRNKFYTLAHMFDLSKPAEKALVEDYKVAMEAIRQTTDIESMMTAYMVCEGKQTVLNESMTAYTNFSNSVKDLQAQINSGNITSDGIEVLETYMNTNSGPSAEYPQGTYLYIMEQCMLSTDQITDEILFMQSLVEKYSKLEYEDPISSSLTFVCGDLGANDAEGPACLMDGNRENKWCAARDLARTIGSDAWDVVFMADEPVTPRFYELVTGNDTEGNPSRNWTKWNIYGANLDVNEIEPLLGNMDDAVATEIVQSDKWVLLDSRDGDPLPAANFASATFFMNQNVTEKFQFFRVEIISTGGDLHQMSELTLMNNGNLIENRDEHVAEMEAFNTDVIAQASLIEKFRDTLEKLRDANNANTISTYYNMLKTLSGQITTSAEAYQMYMDTVQVIKDEIQFETGEQFDFLKNYLEATVEPGNGYPNGSYEYIIENCLLSADEIRNEAYYVGGLYSSTLNGAYFALGGSSNNFSANEGYAALVDGDWKTKWGRASVEDAFAIFMTPTTQAPYFYTLVTGNDTDRYSGRNWKSWSIYGANFESPSQAVKDAPEWVLIDQKENIGQDRLGAASYAPFYFGFSEENIAEYKYYKVVVTAAYSGTSIQMSEFTFGTKEEFEAIRDEIVEKALGYNIDQRAELALLDGYEAGCDELAECVGMEEVMAKYSELVAMQSAIATSAAAYDALETQKEEIEAYLEANPGIEGAAYDKLKSYLEDDVEPGADFTNGSYGYINENLQLNADQVKAEIENLKALFQQAIATGYVAGNDVTMLLQNPDFSKGFKGWEGQAYGKNCGTGNYDNSYAAEVWSHGFNYYQTLTGLKNGVYELQMDAAYRPNTDLPECTNLAAKIYANNDYVYVISTYEDMISKEEAIDRENCYLNWSDDLHDIVIVDESTADTLGYIPRGIQSAVYAFKGGRYHNRILTNVTDGTLTVGITDPGLNAGNQWTGFGNAKLTYLGTTEDADASIDETLKGQAARAQTVLDTNYDLAQATIYPNFSQELKNGLTEAIAATESVSTPAEKYNLVGTFSKLFNDVYDSKNAYIEISYVWDKIQDKWSTQLLPEDVLEELFSTEDDVWSKWEEGAYSTEDAKSVRSFLYEKFPDWLVANTDVARNNLEVTATGMFEYHVDANGKDPFVAFTGFYEDLSAERTILAFDYKSDVDLFDGKFYFVANYMDGTRELTYSAPASSEWKSLYYDITTARTEWGWGSVGHWLRWDVTNNASAPVSFDIRKVRIITPAQMEAEGGEITIPESSVGDGTSGNPYILQSKADLMSMESKMTPGRKTYFKMTKDVDMDGCQWHPLNLVQDYANWIDLDGNGHVIKNLTLTNAQQDYNSFFGVFCGDIRNIGFEDAYCTCDATGSGILGGYVSHEQFCDGSGNLYTSHIENVYVTGKIENNSMSYCGGMFGTVGGPTEIKNCYVNVEVVGCSDNTGGFVARTKDELKMTNCYAAGSINRGGGIVGTTSAPATFENITVWNNTDSNFGATAEGNVLTNISYFDGSNFAELQKTVVAYDPNVWYCDNAEGSYPTFKWQTTGIANLTAGTEAGKSIYNLQGQKVEKPRKGIYIIDRKKVLVK